MALVGPTASGKSALAFALAQVRPEAELVSVDSMAVYRGMDIGTAKPGAADAAAVPYHLLDLVDPDEEFTVQRFQAAAAGTVAGIEERGHRALLVGGTGLYLRAVVDGLDAGPLARGGRRRSRPRRMVPAAWSGSTGDCRPRSRGRLPDHPHQPAPCGAGPRGHARLGPALLLLRARARGLPAFAVHHGGHPPRPAALDRRIEERFGCLLRRGLVEEVRALAARPAGLSRTARQALGYRELLAHVEQGVALDAAVSEALRRTRAFARRQWAWFRRDPRICWLDPGGDLLAQLLGVWDRSQVGQ